MKRTTREWIRKAESDFQLAHRHRPRKQTIS
jgi:hypothetical protein